VGTSNPDKVREYARLLTTVALGVVFPTDLGLELDIVEDGATFLANAQRKARAYANASGLPTLSEDAGLVVDALDGRPGVLSARYGGAGLSDAERNTVLLRELEGRGERAARFICVIALAGPHGRAGKVFVGQCDGRIARQPRGDQGFGYDPVFVLPDGRTMAELAPQEKDTVSHRGRAVAEMLRSINLRAWAAAVRIKDGAPVG
jgi:XTP/dITP diphosphohydrolase